MKRKGLRQFEPLVYLFPALLFFLLFTYYPFIKTVFNSFFLTNFMGVRREFVGPENYIRILQDKDFLAAVKNTFIYVITSVPVSVLIALVLAMVASRKTLCSPVYETMYALPMAMSSSVCAMIFELMYNPSLGILNEILGTNISWLTDSRFTIYAISFISVWMNIGYNFLFLLAAVRNVPSDLIEAATMEGTGPIRLTTRIILPIISPTVFFLIINSLAKSMMMSGLVIILSDGGRSGSASTMISYMYTQSVNAQNYNNGYAAAVVAFIITFALMLLSFGFEKKYVNYD
ncbi:MAG: sugar ABC transporter permease [Oscillospiraceae bacterium]|nr:sugar ABC transporter permease [Oscillospiraceae bacterium]